MSTINPYYTFQYSQPEEYRFSHDSVFLARRVFEAMADLDISALKGLDLCSGCGVIGMDFIFHCHKEKNTAPQSFDFMEVQSVYLEHFKRNAQTLNAETVLDFVNQNYKVLREEEYKNKYDLILCNPPYFRPHQGKMSPSEFKNRCRFFLDADFETLILGIENALSPGGRAYVLLRDLGDHGWSPYSEIQNILTSGKAQKMADIRGTDVVLVTKNLKPL